MKLVFNNKAVAVWLVLVFSCISLSDASGDILDGLVSYWPMDEGSGNTVEDLVSGHNGAAQGTVDWTAGIIGPAIDCRDGQGYILVDQHADLKPTAAMTIQIWARMYSHADWTAIVSNSWDTGDNEAGWEIFSWTPNNRMIFAAAVGGPLRWVYMSPGPDRGEWGHYVGTYDGTRLKGYINGVLMSSENYSGPIN